MGIIEKEHPFVRGSQLSYERKADVMDYTHCRVDANEIFMMRHSKGWTIQKGDRVFGAFNSDFRVYEMSPVPVNYVEVNPDGSLTILRKVNAKLDGDNAEAPGVVTFSQDANYVEFFKDGEACDELEENSTSLKF